MTSLLNKLLEAFNKEALNTANIQIMPRPGSMAMAVVTSVTSKPWDDDPDRRVIVG